MTGVQTCALPISEPALAKATMGELAARRGELERELQRAEERWLNASERREQEAA